MNKERLATIEAKLIMAKEDSISSFTDEFLTEMEYLIGKVKELEADNNSLRNMFIPFLQDNIKELERQNKHYQEGLERFYEDMSRHGKFGKHIPRQISYE